MEILVTQILPIYELFTSLCELLFYWLPCAAGNQTCNNWSTMYCTVGWAKKWRQRGVSICKKKVHNKCTVCTRSQWTWMYFERKRHLNVCTECKEEGKIIWLEKKGLQKYCYPRVWFLKSKVDNNLSIIALFYMRKLVRFVKCNASQLEDYVWFMHFSKKIY